MTCPFRLGGPALLLLTLLTHFTINAGEVHQGETRKNNINNEYPIVEIYHEVKETLRNIFAKGVDPEDEEQEQKFDEPVWRFSSDVYDPTRKKSRFQSFLDSRRRDLLIYGNKELTGSTGDQENVQQANIRQHTHAHAGQEHTNAYLNEWVVHLTGGRELAAAVAKDLGYRFLGQVGEFRDVYRMVKLNHPAAHKRDSPTLTHHLADHAQVVWAEQQYVKERVKRDDYDPFAPLIRVKRLEDAEQETKKESKMKRDKIERKRRSRINRSATASQVKGFEAMFNDELWDHQWYLYDTRTRAELPKLDLQVVRVWEAGVTGRGVRLLVLDDGLEWRHTDLTHNYDAEISYDFNDNDDDPTPRYDSHFSNSHGTRCAGEIAMTANNHKCGVGVAYGARVGGIRMLDGPVSDVVEGLSLSYALDKVDVVSCSWGPTDDGQRVEGPGRLAEMSLQMGVRQGRGGLGTVYVWAAGNGGSAGDNCNCDGYTSSIFTLSISSASETGRFPWYGEQCASTLAAAYSSGAYTDQKIATTDLHNGCTNTFTGTSAAAPLAAGIIALALEVNPRLTWRDIQHAVVWSSEWAPLSHNGGWTTNARGLKVNPRFGYGLLSAEGLVNTVRNWTNVPQQRICKASPTNRSGATLESGGWVLVQFLSDGCHGGDDEVTALEHVQLIATINYTRRGALAITLTSPQGTQTSLLTQRESDRSNKGFTKWAFMSVHTWGENPAGVWSLNISDTSGGEENGTIGELELVLHGTKELPQHMKEQRSYRISYDQVEFKDESEEDEVNLSSQQMKTLSWDQLLQLLAKSTRSTLSTMDIEMLLQDGRLEATLRNIQSQEAKLESLGHITKFDWQLVMDELMARR
ncbi:neuroendocrine convertase 1-like [Cherax quadricarinatus]